MNKLITIFSAVLTSAIIVLSPSVSANSANYSPSGNNGSIKISDQSNPDSIPDNNPHVSCGFNVEFYNYDKGANSATVSFALQSPTAGNGYSLNASGNLHPVINGGQGLIGSEHYTLNFTGKPQTQQGYHVKLTVNAPHSNGVDTKYKVFWIQPCVAVNAATVTNHSGQTNNPNTPKILSNSTEIPATLPNTGASQTLLIFSIVSILAGVSHLAWNRRKASAQ